MRSQSSLEVDSLAGLSKLVHLELAALEVEVAREYPLGSPARAFCPSLAISVRQVEELVLERVSPSWSGILHCTVIVPCATLSPTGGKRHTQYILVKGLRNRYHAHIVLLVFVPISVAVVS